MPIVISFFDPSGTITLIDIVVFLYLVKLMNGFNCFTADAVYRVSTINSLTGAYKSVFQSYTASGP
jgi:hypothetical protein